LVKYADHVLAALFLAAGIREGKKKRAQPSGFRDEKPIRGERVLKSTATQHSKAQQHLGRRTSTLH
jgi:hypothetical protein